MAVGRRTALAAGSALAAEFVLLVNARDAASADGQPLGPWISATAAAPPNGSEVPVTPLETRGTVRVDLRSAAVSPGLLGDLSAGDELLINGAVGQNMTIAASQLVRAVFGDESELAQRRL